MKNTKIKKITQLYPFGNHPHSNRYSAHACEKTTFLLAFSVSRIRIPPSYTCFLLQMDSPFLEYIPLHHGSQIHNLTIHSTFFPA